MFKSASKNEQSRMDRHEFTGRRNIYGIDDSAWRDAHAEKEKLVERKRQVEQDLMKINDQIRAAGRQLHTSGRAVNRNLFESWIGRRKKLVHDLRKIDDTLFEIRKMARQRESVDELSFERVFIQTAKKMLAGPVYDRIVKATIHAIGEEQEDETHNEKCPDR